MELNQVLIYVKDIDVMTAFYRDALGLTLLPEASQQGFHVFSAGGAQLALHSIPPATARGIEVASPPRPREDAPTKLIFSVKDVAGERARLIASGATMKELSSWGACDGVDPEGNIFQISPVA